LRSFILKTKLSSQDIEDLVEGAAVLGVGGGGDPDEGLKSLKGLLGAGKDLMLESIEDLGDDEIVASPYFVGSVAPKANKQTQSEKKNSNGKTMNPDSIAKAFALLEGKLGKKISATIASEIGGGNTAASLAIAARVGIPMIDGDLMGRAGPELHQSTVHIFGFPMSPAAIVSDTGNEIILNSYAGIDDYESIARYVSVISGGHAAVVDTPLDKSRVKRCAIPDTISKCISIGRARRLALSSGQDPVRAIAQNLTKGRKIFEGIVNKYSWKDEAGFLKGECYVEGSGEWSKTMLRSWIMNEHIMCWINNKPVVMPPDLIAFLNPKTGKAITNTLLTKGMDVAVLGSSVDEIWREPKGLQFFGPRHFGLDYDYVPFEELYAT
jgi:DUF917 family protein